MEARCQRSLAQHHQAFLEERARIVVRHDQELEGLREAAAAHIAHGSTVRSGPGAAAGRGEAALPAKATREEQLRRESRAMLAKLAVA